MPKEPQGQKLSTAEQIERLFQSPHPAAASNYHATHSSFARTMAMATVAFLVLVGWSHAGRPPTPPKSPQSDETVIDGRHDPVAIKCSVRESKWAGQSCSPIACAQTLRVLVTHSNKWGTIWRADILVPADNHDPQMNWRAVCSKAGAVETPFDASLSLRLKHNP
jgi:hypothetical protein